jgi:hypothetical protein
MTGDALFGSTVTSLNIGSQALNDLNQFAFSYQLADGREGIAVASNVPEPGSALLLLLGASSLALVRPRSEPAERNPLL